MDCTATSQQCQDFTVVDHITDDNFFLSKNIKNLQKTLKDGWIV
jgi:hypothetical protein